MLLCFAPVGRQAKLCTKACLIWLARIRWRCYCCACLALFVLYFTFIGRARCLAHDQEIRCSSQSKQLEACPVRLCRSRPHCFLSACQYCKDRHSVSFFPRAFSGCKLQASVLDASIGALMFSAGLYCTVLLPSWPAQASECSH